MENLLARTSEMNQDTKARNSLVIVVDDDDAVRNSLKFSLEIEGFAVRLYARGSELLDAPDVADCACLVIDQNMPGLSGLETLNKLRERHVTVPAILITGHPNSMLLARAQGAGVNIIEKPLYGNALIDGIRGVIKH
jgi:two-component system, LuxR family, response regulator FixJ